MNKYSNPKNYLNWLKIRFNNKISIFFPWFFALLKKPRLIKFLVPWYKSLKLRNASLSDRRPWLTFEAMEWIDNYLKKDMIVFEWGSGGSTIYLSKKVKKIISIEHDPEWYGVVSRTIKDNGISNCECVLKEPTVSKNSKLEVPATKNYLSGVETYMGFDFKDYCKTIESFPDRFFNLVLVDGRARPSCIFHALNKILAGGCLILDDSEKTEYLPAINMLKEKWTRKDFFGPGPYTSRFWQTSIFIRDDYSQ